MRITDPNRGKDIGKFFVHTNQLLPKSSCLKLETMKIVPVGSEHESTMAFKVKVSWNCLLYLWSHLNTNFTCYRLARFWSCASPSIGPTSGRVI